MPQLLKSRHYVSCVVQIRLQRLKANCYVENARFIYRGLYTEFNIVIGHDPTLKPNVHDTSIIDFQHRHDSGIYMNRSSRSRSLRPFSVTPSPRSSSCPDSDAPGTPPASSRASFAYVGFPTSYQQSNSHHQVSSTYAQVYAALIGFKPTSPQKPFKEPLLLQTASCDDEVSAKQKLYDLTTVEVHNRIAASKEHAISLEALATSAKVLEELPPGWRLLLHKDYGMICFANDNAKDGKQKVHFQLPGYKNRARRVAVIIPKETLVDETAAEYPMPPEGFDRMFYEGGDNKQVLGRFAMEKARRVALQDWPSDIHEDGDFLDEDGKMDEGLFPSRDASGGASHPLTSNEWRNSCVIL